MRMSGLLVFPAHAGMDRAPGARLGPRYCVPRARGDGPLIRQDYTPSACVFPAHAGMDRRQADPGGVRDGVPRARGDGPEILR